MTPSDFLLWLRDPRRQPLVMGVLNVTPDSFSDGGQYAAADAAIAHAEEMAAAGADLLDVGGESTRPGSDPVPAAVQIGRIVPVIQAASGRLSVTLSVDTTSAAVARAALDAGAALVNDVSAGRHDPAMLPLAAERGAPIVLMHMQGDPKTMQVAPFYEDVAGEVAMFLRDRVAAAVEAGVPLDKILLDPGIGFGKSQEHNLELMRHQYKLTALGRPLLVGASRKKFIGTITGEPEAHNRHFGTAAAVAWAIAHGASIVRVHDVKPMRQVVAMTRAIMGFPEAAGSH